MFIIGLSFLQVAALGQQPSLSSLTSGRLESANSGLSLLVLDRRCEVVSVGYQCTKLFGGVIVGTDDIIQRPHASQRTQKALNSVEVAIPNLIVGPTNPCSPILLILCNKQFFEFR
jgi:hypothetical protein